MMGVANHKKNKNNTPFNSNLIFSSRPCAYQASNVFINNCFFGFYASLDGILFAKLR